MSGSPKSSSLFKTECMLLRSSSTSCLIKNSIEIKKIIENPKLSGLFKRTVNRFQKKVNNSDCMPNFNIIKVEDYAALFRSTAVVQASDSITALT